MSLSCLLWSYLYLARQFHLIKIERMAAASFGASCQVEYPSDLFSPDTVDCPHLRRRTKVLAADSVLREDPSSLVRVLDDCGIDYLNLPGPPECKYNPLL